MLTEKEKAGALELLGLLPVSDLQSLAQTVTSNMLVLVTRSEAMTAIILHTDKAVDLLKRKKIKKEVLFKYLHGKRVPIEAVADKPVHVARVLEVWGTELPLGDLTVLDETSQDPKPAPAPTASCHNSVSPAPTASRHSSVSLAPTASRHSSVPEARDQNYNRCLELQSSGSDHGPLVTSEPAATGQIALQCQELAVSFVRWFYHLLNTSGNTDSSDWNSSHFWPDASARVSLLSQAGEVVECLEVVTNSEAASQMLLDVIRQHKLTFNPNLCSEGVRGKVSPHGLMMVLACGTLHHQNTVCGVFEQVFGLVRDPGAENNWKIKQTEARLRGGQGEVVPRVNTCQLEAVEYHDGRITEIEETDEEL